jgi:hypothetical protein
MPASGSRSHHQAAQSAQFLWGQSSSSAFRTVMARSRLAGIVTRTAGARASRMRPHALCSVAPSNTAWRRSGRSRTWTAIGPGRSATGSGCAARRHASLVSRTEPHVLDPVDGTVNGHTSLPISPCRASQLSAETRTSPPGELAGGARHRAFRGRRAIAHQYRADIEGVSARPGGRRLVGEGPRSASA